ncbi:hypothetical protein [Xanthomonas axonopodis]|uniref:hypothetical protein n=1 Tax=Xanthomonas axonopodis TaxID=53413 RepID=UPI0035574A6E
MRLDFNILWIDDQPKHIESFREGLQNKLSDLGFNLNVTKIERLEDVEGRVSSHVHEDGVDLVLVDYDLGTEGHDGGERALFEVRRKFQYKEVVFYSATDTDKLREIAYKNKIDGINFSTRLSLVDDAFEIINKLLARVLDIDHMRGLVMSATSDIDSMVEASLTAVYEKLDQQRQKEFLIKIAEQMRKKLSGWSEDLERAATKGELFALLKLKAIYTANDRLKSLHGHLEILGESQTTISEKVKEYQDDVVPRRNKLAHKKIEGSKVCAPGEEFSLDNMKKLRCDLIEHRENFCKIAVLVDVNF